MALLLAVVYFFAVVFSGFFHTHINHYNPANDSVKTTPGSAKLINFGGGDDCFNAHFYGAGTGVLHAQEMFWSSFLGEGTVPKFFYTSFCSSEDIIYFSLRGPPFLF